MQLEGKTEKNHASKVIKKSNNQIEKSKSHGKIQKFLIEDKKNLIVKSQSHEIVKKSQH